MHDVNIVWGALDGYAAKFRKEDPEVPNDRCRGPSSYSFWTFQGPGSYTDPWSAGLPGLSIGERGKLILVFVSLIQARAPMFSYEFSLKQAMRWVVVIFLVLIVGNCEGWIPPIHSHGLSRPHSSSGRLRETASTFARYAIPPAPTVVNMEEDDGDDEADEEGELLGFKEETEFLDQMKALIEKTSAFSTKRNEEAYEEQRERKTEMLEELKRIDGAVGVNEETGAGNSGGDAMMSKEGLVEELRKAFSSETKEPELDDFMPEIESDDYGANAMADMLDATAATDAVDENAINRLRETFGSSRENVDGKRAGASKASQMLQAAASGENSEAQSRLTPSDPVAIASPRPNRTSWSLCRAACLPSCGPSRSVPAARSRPRKQSWMSWASARSADRRS